MALPQCGEGSEAAGNSNDNISKSNSTFIIRNMKNLLGKLKMIKHQSFKLIYEEKVKLSVISKHGLSGFDNLSSTYCRGSTLSFLEQTTNRLGSTKL